jgi:hypothetical protein
VLAAAEALLLGGGDDPAVDDERGRRIVEDGVAAPLTASSGPEGRRSAALSVI